jgi:predicted signal transduction protein with EAL and GGDEF domain
MNKMITKSQMVSIYPAILILWCVAASVGLIAFYPQMGMMGASILIFVTVISLLDLFPLSSWVALLVGVGAYFTIFTSMYTINRSSLVQVGIVGLVYTGTVILSDIFVHQIRSLNKEVAKEQTLMKDLIQYDQSTGIMRWKFARQQLAMEVLRSKRYKKNLSLVLLQPIISPDLKMTDQETAALNGQIAEVILSEIRKDVDIPFIGEKVGIILPETSVEGAQILCGRLAENAFRKVRVDLAIGIASVPNDAVTDDILIANAELAMKFAVSSGQIVVPYSRLREGAIHETPSEPEVKVETVKSPKTENTVGLSRDEFILEFHNFLSLNLLPQLEQAIRTSDSFRNDQMLGLNGNVLRIKVNLFKGDILEILHTLPGLTASSIERDGQIIKIILA